MATVVKKVVKSKEEKENEKKLNELVSKFSFNYDDEEETPKWKTGVVMLDHALSGGFPQGRCISLGSEAGVGKTTMLVQACGNICREYGADCYYLDIEGGATLELITSMGYGDVLKSSVNPDGTFHLMNKISTIQDVATFLNYASRDDNTAVVVIDSDKMVIDANDLAQDNLGTDDKAIGKHARMWSSNAGQILAVVKRSKMCLVLIHQARVSFTGMFAKVDSSQSSASKHLTSADMFGKNMGYISPDNKIKGKSDKDRDGSVGALMELTVRKNRLGLPFQKVNLPIFFGKGVKNSWAYKTWLENHGEVDEITGEVKPYLEVGGSWFTFNLPFAYGQKVQGENKVYDFIDDNLEDIEAFIDSKGGVDGSGQTQEATDEDLAQGEITREA